MAVQKNYGALIQKGPAQREKRILIMGVEGVGKTTALVQCPNPIVLCAEDGITEEQFAGVSHYSPSDWSDTFGFLDYLINSEHNHKTLGIDTVDWLEPLAVRHMCFRDGKKDIEEYGGYGKGQVVLANEFRPLLVKLEQLQRAKNMLIVMTAHTQVKQFNNPMGDNYDRFEPACEKKVSALIKQWCDVNLFARFDTATYKDSKKARAKGVGGQTRIVHTTFSAAWDAKNRCNLPAEMPFDMPTILEAIKNGAPDTADNIFADCTELAKKYLTDNKIQKTTLDFLEKNKTNTSALTIALNKLKHIASQADSTQEPAPETQAA